MDLDGIDTIYIKNGSQPLHLISADRANLEIDDGNRDIVIEENDNEVVLEAKQKWFHIGPKINLNRQFQVTVPENFTGEIIVDGGSGNVTSDNLITNHLEVRAASGNVTLNFAEFHSGIDVNTTSGNVDILLNTTRPDIDLEVKTTSGHQIITVPLEVTGEQSNKMIEGKYGKGTHHVRVKTTSGNITIK